MIFFIQLSKEADQCNAFGNKLLYQSTTLMQCVSQCKNNDVNLIDRDYNCLKSCVTDVVFCDERCPKFVNGSQFCVDSCFSFVLLKGGSYFCVGSCPSNLTFQTQHYRNCTASGVCPSQFPYFNASARNCYESCADFVKVENETKFCELVCASRTFIQQQQDRVCVAACPANYYRQPSSFRYFECVQACFSGIYGENQSCLDACPKYYQSTGGKITCAESCTGFLQNQSAKLFCIARCDLYVQVSSYEKLCVEKCPNKYFNDSYFCQDSCSNYVIENEVFQSSNQCSNQCFTGYFITIEGLKHCVQSCLPLQFKLVSNGYNQCLQVCPENFLADKNRICVCSNKLEGSVCKPSNEPKLSTQTVIIIAVTVSVVAILVITVLLVICGIIKKKRAEEKKQTQGKFSVVRKRQEQLVSTSQKSGRLGRGHMDNTSSNLSNNLRGSMVSIPTNIVKRRSQNLVPAAGDVPFF